MTTPFHHQLHSYYPEIRRWRSTKKFLCSGLYKKIALQLEGLLTTGELENFAEQAAVQQVSGSSCSVFRAVSWNIERGMVFDGVLETLRNHPEISSADIFFCPESDLGMARSQNRNVARDLAQALGLNYVFFPSYLNLDKGNALEVEAEGENLLGLHGNVIFSRWPLKNPRGIRLKNCKDKLRGREKRLGSQQAVVADVDLPAGTARAVCVHLDAHSSQRQRYQQMRTIVEALARENFSGPTLIGGDWNTSTYYASHAFFAFFSFWRKVAMGPKKVCERHYIYPERYFERRLFSFLDKQNFDWKNFNALGVPTMHYHLGDERKNKNMRDWTPGFFQVFVDWAMRKAKGLAQFKIDWFAAQNLKPVEGSQKVIGNLTHNGAPISDHDAIAVDFQLT